MNPEIWSRLPFDIIERIASFADIDSRRALGFHPRKLGRSIFIHRPIGPTTWRYFPALKKLVYINFDESYDVFCWEVYEDIEPVAGGEAWFHGPNGSHRGVWRGIDDFITFDNNDGHFPFHFAGAPDIIQ